MSCSCDKGKTNLAEVQHEDRCIVRILQPTFRSMETTLDKVVSQVSLNSDSLSKQGQEVVTLGRRQSNLEADLASLQQETVPLLQATVREQGAEMDKMAKTIHQLTSKVSRHRLDSITWFVTTQ